MCPRAPKRWLSLLCVVLAAASCSTPGATRLGSSPRDVPGGIGPVFKPLLVLPNPRPPDSERRGTPLEVLSGRDVPVKDILLTLFKDSDLNLLVGEDVGGTATFDIKETTAERAFSTLLAHLDLAYEIVDDFVVVTATEHRTFNLDLLETSLVEGATIGNLWEQVKTDIEMIVDETDKVIVSPLSGSIEVEASPRSVMEIEEYLDNLIARVTNQVSLEARIIEVGLTDEFRLGVDWSIVDSWLTSDNSWFTADITGSLSGGDILQQQASSGADVFNLGFVNDGRFSLFIDALESQGQVRVLSSPRVSTMNNVPATMRVVDAIPVIDREVIDTEAGSRTEFAIRFVDSGVTITALPQVGSDGHITIWINPIITEQTGTVTTPDGLVTEPILSTREASTMIRVRDGQAIVLGGMRTTRKVETLLETPVLSKIPILGFLFRSTIQQIEEIELIVIVVPRVLSPDWIDEDLQRSVAAIMDLKRDFVGSSLPAMNDTSNESYVEGHLSSEPFATARAQFDELGEGNALESLATLPPATITRGGLAAAGLERALEALDEEQSNHALALLEETSRLDPEDTEALVIAGYVELRRHRLGEAAAYLDRALTRRHDDPTALTLRGILAVQRGLDGPALGYLEKAHLIAPSPLVANNLAAVLLRTGCVEEARDLLMTPEMAGSGLAEVHLNRAYVQLVDLELPAAMQSIEAALAAGAPADSRWVLALRTFAATIAAEYPVALTDPGRTQGDEMPADDAQGELDAALTE